MSAASPAELPKTCPFGHFKTSRVITPLAGHALCLVPALVAKRRGPSTSVRHRELDLPGFCGERLVHFAGLSLEGDGALEAER